MSDINKRRPEFATSIRGYDRLQVDDYIERLHHLVTYAEQRARDAESELEFRNAESELDLSGHASVGPRVSEILDLAVAEAQELRKRIKQQAETLSARARREAEEIIESAHAQAAEAREQALRERTDALARLDSERQRARVEIVELRGRQTELLANLRQLQSALGAAVSLIPEHAEAPADHGERDQAGGEHDQAAGEPRQHRQMEPRWSTEAGHLPVLGEAFGGDGGAEESPDGVVPLRVLAR